MSAGSDPAWLSSHRQLVFAIIASQFTAVSLAFAAASKHRRLLKRALLSEGLGEYLTAMPDVGDDEDFERPREMPRTVAL